MGWDIIFFWVVWMIMMGYEYVLGLLDEKIKIMKGVQFFNDVYFIGMVCDKDCCKMSKLFGNLFDVLQFIENYGVDGVCFVMFFSVVVGNDIVFDVFFDLEMKEVLNESKFCEQGCNFCNKMWNVFCFMKGWEVKVGEGDVINCLVVQWME